MKKIKKVNTFSKRKRIISERYKKNQYTGSSAYQKGQSQEIPVEILNLLSQLAPADFFKGKVMVPYNIETAVYLCEDKNKKPSDIVFLSDQKEKTQDAQMMNLEVA